MVKDLRKQPTTPRQVGFKDPNRPKNGGPVLNVGSFEDAHAKSDVDSEPKAQHHTLGFGGNQAAPGSTVKKRLDALDAYNFNNGRWNDLIPNWPNVPLNAGATLRSRFQVTGKTLKVQQHCTLSGAVSAQAYFDTPFQIKAGHTTSIMQPVGTISVIKQGVGYAMGWMYVSNITPSRLSAFIVSPDGTGYNGFIVGPNAPIAGGVPWAAGDVWGIEYEVELD